MTGPQHASVLRRPRVLAVVALVAAVALVVTLVVVLTHSGSSTKGDGTSGLSGTPTRPTPSPSFSLPADTTTDVPRLPQPAASLAPAGSGVTALGPAVGFGQNTTGGAGGEVYHVTSGADTVTDPQPGTLRYGLTQQKPLWIVFDSDLTVRFAGAMVPAPDKTIDGRGRKVTFTGHGRPGLHLYDTHNIVVENITFHDFGDVAKTSQNDPNDEIDMQRASDVWIDHCTMSMAGDKLISTEDGATRITLSWNHFLDQEQGIQIGTISTAPTDVETLVTMYDNFFDRLGYREPLVAYAKVHVFNNYMYEWRNSAVRSERLAQIYLEANVFDPGSSRKGALIRPASRCNDSHKFCDGRPGYLYSTGNTLADRVTVRATGSDHVFDPSAAYSYTAQPAGPALVDAIKAGSGVR